MSLHTPAYLAFLILVVLLYWRLRSPVLRRAFLLASSYLFYAFFDYRFLLILISLTLLTYWIGLQIPRRGYRQGLAWLSAALSLGLLGVFKYTGFILDNLIPLLDSLNIAPVSPGLRLLLPVGISFYTFQAISYTTDIYRKRIQPTTDLIEYALYLGFFPKLIAGPLLQPDAFFKQLHTGSPKPSPEQIRAALNRLVFGLFLKIVIADTLAGQSSSAYDAAALMREGSTFASPLFIQGFYLYAFQIFADFAGYTHIALASASLLGFALPENFNQPYFAITLTDFWNRWHMSLTRWFREYLFFPLTRALLQKTSRRFPALIQVIANLATMLLIGLWHGAAWTFVAWGFFHGILLTLEKIVPIKPQNSWQRLLSGIITFHLVCIGWVFFRAESFATAFAFFRGLFSFNQMSWLGYYLPSILVTASAVFLIEWLPSQQSRPFARLLSQSRPILVTAAVVIMIVLELLSLARGDGSYPFIYGLF